MILNIPDIPEDKQKIIKALLNKIENKYKDDIALVVCYGSYIKGSPHLYSDVDFFFIPKTDRGYEMSSQFIIDDIGYDFWPLSWERAQRIANFEEPLVSIIADGEIIYYHKREDLKKFNSLKQRLKELTQNKENKKILKSRAGKLLEKAKTLFFDMQYQHKDYEQIDRDCYQILKWLANTTALLNSTYLKKGASNLENEIKYLSLVPENFLRFFKKAAQSRKVNRKKEYIRKLIMKMDDLLQDHLTFSSQAFNRKNCQGFYEEMKSQYNKLIYAGENHDYFKKYFTTHAIDIETRNLLKKKYKKYDFPHLVFHINEKDADKFKKLINKHERKLVNFLKDNNIEIKEYENIETFLQDF